MSASSKHPPRHIERWAPVALSDKQFAGYVWARGASTSQTIPKARLLAHCSAAVRPRGDVKAKAYNLLLELQGKEEADDLAALLEDREGVRALMRVSKGDPEDITPERMPFIVEKVKLAAGEFAAAKEREQGEEKLRQLREQAEKESKRIKRESLEEQKRTDIQATELKKQLVQQKKESERLSQALFENTLREKSERLLKYQTAFSSAITFYKRARLGVALCATIITALVTYYSGDLGIVYAIFAGLIIFCGFHYVPVLTRKALHSCADKVLCSRLRAAYIADDWESAPDYEAESWPDLRQVEQDLEDSKRNVPQAVATISEQREEDSSMNVGLASVSVAYDAVRGSV
ncbi:hypothetical protein [Alcaligenes faecalis]|uniref:hypothetical protein n=1 Tax=Alcaligenes faecalis TaxID=511 RepID=UPI0024BC3277|nr:hypothetical protein [Alcaligenes faecalis]WHQ45967.1 hypothetical protein E8D21_20205 [Alcaligenes faecalis]